MSFIFIFLFFCYCSGQYFLDYPSEVRTPQLAGRIYELRTLTNCKFVIRMFVTNSYFDGVHSSFVRMKFGIWRHNRLYKLIIYFFKYITKFNLVPSLTLLSSVISSEHFLIFGRPIPAPKPSSRTQSGAVE